jgi:hypothetical protein
VKSILQVLRVRISFLTSPLFGGGGDHTGKGLKRIKAG